MKLRFLKSCVFAGCDRKPGEIIAAAPSPSASIVTGAGQAEWVEDAPEATETSVPREKTPDTDETKTPAKTARKAKKK